MFQVTWEFEVRRDRLAEFAAAYGPDGGWVRLFRADAGYLGTDVKQISPTRWLTVDRWNSRASYEAFRAARANEYAALDEHCAALTTSERKLDERDV